MKPADLPIESRLAELVWILVIGLAVLVAIRLFAGRREHPEPVEHEEPDARTCTREDRVRAAADDFMREW